MNMKSSTLVVATKRAGACAACRHTNQGTVDFSEGLLFCAIAKRPKPSSQECDVTVPLGRTKSTPLAAFERYFMFEPYDGDNGTFDRAEDLRIVAEDADDELRASLKADQPFIDAGP